MIETIKDLVYDKDYLDDHFKKLETIKVLEYNNMTYFKIEQDNKQAKKVYFVLEQLLYAFLISGFNVYEIKGVLGISRMLTIKIDKINEDVEKDCNKVIDKLKMGWLHDKYIVLDVSSWDDEVTISVIQTAYCEVGLIDIAMLLELTLIKMTDTII